MVNPLYEDFYFAKIVDNPCPDVYPGIPGDFVLFHAHDGASTPIVGVSLDYLAGYFRGATEWKPKEHITLINGATTKGRCGWFPKLELTCLSLEDLETLLNSAKLNRKHTVSDFK